MAISKFKEDQPKNGEVVLFCNHPAFDGKHHWFRTELAEFTRPDGTTGESRWLCLCEPCFIKFDNPVEAIMSDFTWEGDEPIIKEGHQ